MAAGLIGARTIAEVGRRNHQAVIFGYESCPVLCDLVAGGVPDEIYAGKAAELLAGVEPDSAIAAARVELAEELLEDLRRVDGQLAESKKRLEQVVAASGTTVVAIFGVGPVVAATVVGLTGDVARFPTRDRFAAFNGTAPIEVSSGGRKVWRLSRRGNRSLNHAIHMAAVTQLRFAHSPGRGYYDRKIAEGKTKKEALRALKRRISDALSGWPWSPMPDAPQPPRRHHGRRVREGKRGASLSPARPAHTPISRLFSSATPEPEPRLRQRTRAADAQQPARPRRLHEELLDNQRGLDLCGWVVGQANKCPGAYRQVWRSLTLTSRE